MVNTTGLQSSQVSPERDQFGQVFKKRLSETVSGTTCHTLKEQGAKFCEETTLHGFQYLRTPGIVWKFLWGLVVFSAVCSCIGFLVSSWSEYLSVSAQF